MSTLLRLSEHPRSQEWLAQFKSTRDRSLATQLLNQIRLVSGREFESGIIRTLVELQTRLGGPIATFPIAPPSDDNIVGHHPFKGAIPLSTEKAAPRAGRRRQYGSEDRVGHLLSKLQDEYRRPNGCSTIECAPTITQLESQGIKHIVLVDDICGSGIRIRKYWKKTFPNKLKRLLSLKKYTLWIVLYGITKAGLKNIASCMPRFPIQSNLISVLPTTKLSDIISDEIIELCSTYTSNAGKSSSIGFKGSACPIIFEHGCPNNLPIILWKQQGRFSPLFPNRAIPEDLRACFEKNDSTVAIEALWTANQPKLALSLIDSLERTTPLSSEQRMLLTMLGLRLRNVAEYNLASRLLLEKSECVRLLNLANEMNLYSLKDQQVTCLGQELVSRFRRRTKKPGRAGLGKSPQEYYPSQCEGVIQILGITDGEHPLVPME